MSNTASVNKRIAQNTIALMLRLLVTMIVSVYTSRVVLACLGVVDYGIYNVVGGIVGMFSFLTGSMLDSTQRFLNFHLGRTDYEQLNKIFSTSVNIFFLLALAVTIICEFVGIYMLENTLDIPADRLLTTHIVFQLSLITTFINISSVPYNALIVAHEKMTTYAYVSVVQALGLLAISYAIGLSSWDRLILYAILISVLTISIRIFYTIYCRHSFPKIKYNFIRDFSILKEMMSFSVWTLTSTFAYMTYTQGLTMLVNVFFGPAVNAAQSLANQVNNALSAFANNVSIASKPQIVKYYALGKIEEMRDLIYMCTKLAYTIMLILAVPFFVRVNYVLGLWLKEVPEYTDIFLRLLLFAALISTLSNPVVTGVQATGNIKKFQFGISLTTIMILPCSYCLFKIGADPEWAYYSMLFFLVLAQMVRVYYFSKEFKLSWFDYYKNIISRLFILTITVGFITFKLSTFLPNTFIGFVAFSIVTTIAIIIISVVLVLSSSERQTIINKCLKFINKNGK